jgi:hypothetical protein
MRTRWPALLILVVAMVHVPIAVASAPTAPQSEVEYLLGFIGMSGCEFFRNGSWHDSKAAQAHLRYKYEALASHINSAEEFIEKAATKSSLSGQAYAVRCNDGPTIPNSQWLLEALARYRAAEAPFDPSRTPRVTRDTPDNDGFDPTRN